MKKRSLALIVGTTCIGLIAFECVWANRSKAKALAEPTLTIVTESNGGLTFSPDDKLIAATGIEKPVKIYSVKTGEIVSRLENSREGSHVTFPPSGKTIIGILNNQAVGVWDARTGRKKAVLKGHRGLAPVRMPAFDTLTGKNYFIRGKGKTRASVDVVEVSPDEKLLATGSDDKTIDVWSMATAKQLRVFKGHKAPIVGVSFSPNGKTIASADESGGIKVWEPLSGRIAATFTNDSEVFMEWSSNGKEILTLDEEGKTTIRDAKSFRVKGTLKKKSCEPKVETNPTQLVSFSDDGARIAVTDYGDDLTHQSRSLVTLYDTKSGKSLYTLRIATPNSLALSSHGTLLAVGGTDYHKTSRRDVIQIWHTP